MQVKEEDRRRNEGRKEGSGVFTLPVEMRRTYTHTHIQARPRDRIPEPKEKKKREKKQIPVWPPLDQIPE